MHVQGKFIDKKTNQQRMHISVVIPTCDRKARLLSLLQNLDRSSYPAEEVLIVDSGDDRLSPSEYAIFSNLKIQYLVSERSVCIQRNVGIRMASSPWVFLCDDDIELPVDYLQVLANHINLHPEAGAVSGLWLEKENNEWKATHPVRSTRMLLWKYIFQLGIWGEIDCANNILTRRIKKYYQYKGNHISKAGWPVNTDFTGDYSVCPVYSLGASLVKKEWLIHSLYDEVLDRHGIGDNYGVAADFPVPGVHVVSNIFIHHHLESTNRLKRSLQYYRRILALDYFIKTKKNISGVKRKWLVWSLAGNMISFTLSGNGIMIKATFKAVWKIVFGRNPYFIASKKGEKVIEPLL
jgi:glycosyltransferase involved in cell wall biosynthesis